MRVTIVFHLVKQGVYEGDDRFYFVRQGIYGVGDPISFG